MYLIWGGGREIAYFERLNGSFLQKNILFILEKSAIKAGMETCVAHSSTDREVRMIAELTPVESDSFFAVIV